MPGNPLISLQLINYSEVFILIPSKNVPHHTTHNFFQPLTNRDFTSCDEEMALFWYFIGIFIIHNTSWGFQYWNLLCLFVLPIWMELTPFWNFFRHKTNKYQRFIQSEKIIAFRFWIISNISICQFLPSSQLILIVVFSFYAEKWEQGSRKIQLFDKVIIFVAESNSFHFEWSELYWVRSILL